MAGFAQWLADQTELAVTLAKHGVSLEPGKVFLSPDDYHLQVNDRGALELSKAHLYKGLRPSANVLFHSLARWYGPKALAIILSGMGDDGAEGAAAMHKAGSLVFAQEEKSCVVYGMPREAVQRKVVNLIFTPEQIGTVLEQFAKQPAGG
jgi:two-component system chemotaxis response regulator CheB